MQENLPARARVTSLGLRGRLVTLGSGVPVPLQDKCL